MKSLWDRVRKLRFQWRVGLFAAAVLGLATAAAARNQTGVFVGTGAALVFGFLARRELRWEAPDASAQRAGFVLVGLGVLVTLLWFWRLAPAGFGFLGVAASYLGLARLVSYWRYRFRGTPWLGAGVLAACGAAVVIGLPALSPGLPKPAVGAVAFGIVVAPLGLNLFSAYLVRAKLPGPFDRPRAVLAVGGLLALVGGALLLGGATPRFAIPITLGLAVLLFAIAVDVAADIVIVVGVVALGASLLPRVAELDRVVQPEEGDRVMVVLGDSYTSGEGATKYYEGTNDRGENECRRSPRAYGPLAAARNERIDAAVFVACSGALAEHITVQAQYADDPAGRPPAYGRRGLPQLAHYEWLRREPPKDLDVKLVVIGIGGNDAGFGDIGRSCIGPGNCAEYGQRWLDELPQVHAKLRDAFGRVDQAFPDAKVLVVPYPIPLNERRCSYSTLQPDEHRFLAAFTRELDGVLKAAAENAGFHYLGEVEDSLAGAKRRICDTEDPDDSGINFVAWHPVDGVLEESANPRNWLHNSLHPNARGHSVVAGLLSSWIDRSDALPTRAEKRPTAVPRKTLVDLGFDAGFDHCERPGTTLFCGDGPMDWLVDRTAGELRRAGPAVALLSLGLWLTAIGAIRAWREWRKRRAEKAAAGAAAAAAAAVAEEA